MSIRIREMAYHKVKLNKILSRVTGKPESQVGQPEIILMMIYFYKNTVLDYRSCIDSMYNSYNNSFLG